MTAPAMEERDGWRRVRPSADNVPAEREDERAARGIVSFAGRRDADRSDQPPGPSAVLNVNVTRAAPVSVYCTVRMTGRVQLR